MKVKTERHDIGVIVGRFQVPELHDAHRALIKHVCEQHDRVLIFLGLSPIPATRENPLDFDARRQMIQDEFPDVEVLYIKDMGSDEAWSKRLDEQIADVCPVGLSVCLYGGRESFINHYRGKHTTCELESDIYINSGTEIRKQIARGRSRNSVDFRRGVIAAAHKRFPTAFMAVDIAIFSGEDEKRILLVRKPHEPAWRLPGGFVDPGSPSLEANARREAQEETGVTITDPVYVSSHAIDDWRYRGEVDCVMTSLFKATYMAGPVRADDDVAEAKWFNVDELNPADIMPNHQPLLLDVIGRWRGIAR